MPEQIPAHIRHRTDCTCNECHAEIVVKEDMYAPWTWYIATFGDYDLDCTYGSGRTPLDAIVDLLDNAAED